MSGAQLRQAILAAQGAQRNANLKVYPNVQRIRHLVESDHALMILFEEMPNSDLERHQIEDLWNYTFADEFGINGRQTFYRLRDRFRGRDGAGRGQQTWEAIEIATAQDRQDVIDRLHASAVVLGIHIHPLDLGEDESEDEDEDEHGEGDSDADDEQMDDVDDEHMDNVNDEQSSPLSTLSSDLTPFRHEQNSQMNHANGEQMDDVNDEQSSPLPSLPSNLNVFRYEQNSHALPFARISVPQPQYQGPVDLDEIEMGGGGYFGQILTTNAPVSPDRWLLTQALSPPVAGPLKLETDEVEPDAWAVHIAVTIYERNPWLEERTDKSDITFGHMIDRLVRTDAALGSRWFSWPPTDGMMPYSIGGLPGFDGIVQVADGCLHLTPAADLPWFSHHPELTRDPWLPEGDRQDYMLSTSQAVMFVMYCYPCVTRVEVELLISTRSFSQVLTYFNMLHAPQLRWDLTMLDEALAYVHSDRVTSFFMNDNTVWSGQFRMDL